MYNGLQNSGDAGTPSLDPIDGYIIFTLSGKGLSNICVPYLKKGEREDTDWSNLESGNNVQTAASKSDAERTYVPEHKGERGVLVARGVWRTNSLECYIRENNEPILKTPVLKVLSKPWKTIRPVEHKRKQIEDTENIASLGNENNA